MKQIYCANTVLGFSYIRTLELYTVSAVSVTKSVFASENYKQRFQNI